MRFTSAEGRAKLSKPIEIEGYDSIEQLAEAILSDSVSPAICMNEGCNFSCENGARPGCRLLRGVPHQFDALRSNSRRTDLMTMSLPSPRDGLLAGFLLKTLSAICLL